MERCWARMRIGKIKAREWQFHIPLVAISVILQRCVDKKSSRPGVRDTLVAVYCCATIFCSTGP